VYRNEYRDFHEAAASIGEFLERVYNQKRLHSALGYLIVVPGFQTSQ
jgi:transposase InsO family protein